jgi:hypothetical protein
MRDGFLARRTVLRGVGATIALPFLDAMLPRGVGPAAHAATASALAPQQARAIFVFFPNGVNPASWRPQIDANGAWSPSSALAPLESMRREITVHTGLRHRHAEANGDGPGDHARSAACFLTGMQPKKTAGDDIRAGQSVDQAIADALERRGERSRFRSLELGTEPAMTAGNCDSGYSCAYSANISWKGESLPNGKETDAKAAFDRLFGRVGQTPAQAAAQARSRRSILDGALTQARRIAGTVGRDDRARLDEYMDAVRGLEQRVAEDAASQLDADRIPEFGGGPLDLARRTDLLSQVLALALQTDSTRVATFMLANEGSNRPYAEVGVTQGHHDVSHHGNDPAKMDAFTRITTFHSERFAALLRALDAAKEGSRSVLDSTIVLYGGAITDGNVHNHADLPILVAGGSALGLKGGRTLAHAPDTPLCNLHRGIAAKVGAPLDAFGDSTGAAELA